MNKTILLLCFLSCFGFTNAQNATRAFSPPEHVFGQLIVQLEPKANLDAVIAKINRLAAAAGSVAHLHAIVPEWRYHLLAFDEMQVDPKALITECSKMSEISAIQLNHIVEYRTKEPNDPDWFLQSDMSYIHAPEAWSVSTGGVTPSGDTIVVAVLEKGILFNHPDLAPNRFWNWDDAPNDDVDNDGNGYVDDRGGWNVQAENDGTGDNSDHGTEVAGIVGARGDNGLGIAGVNWNVKMLSVTGVFDDEDILKAYRYVYVMRKLYNDTNGEKGAFIVATNASFGYDFQWYYSTGNFNTWCNLFDTLGMIGVLNVGATANKDVNVEEKGDMPTSCPSEFLVSVTNIDKLGNKVPSSGYGAVSIDLGAPGDGVHSTTNVGANTPGYGTINGTSGATPHVTGTVALLYSLGCEAFTSDAISNPVACARRMRDVILNNTAPNTTLDGITVTGGNLDIELAVNGVTKLCEGAVGKLSVLQMRVSETGVVRIFYQTPTFFPYRFRVFNMLGQQLYEEELNPDRFSENSITFDTFDLPKGVYVFSISRGEAIVSVKFPKT
ncbi:MAG: S8 family peptidase [Saprospiraceae bacterium]|nr:S8 family peptidase [Saprospiraceae bacterium]